MNRDYPAMSVYYYHVTVLKILYIYKIDFTTSSNKKYIIIIVHQLYTLWQTS